MATTVRLLGRVAVFHDGREAVLAGREPRALLAALVLAGRDGVRSTRLAELLWGDDQPVAPVAGIRRHLDQVDGAFGDTSAVWQVERTEDGWRALVLPPTDAGALAGLAAETGPGRETAARVHHEIAGAATALLATPLDGLRHPWFAGHRQRLERVQVDALVRFARACRDLDEPDDTVPLLERAVRQPRFAAEPSLWEALALAHVRAGRPGLAQEAVAGGARVLGRDPAVAHRFETLRHRLNTMAFEEEVRRQEAAARSAGPVPRPARPAPVPHGPAGRRPPQAAGPPVTLRFALFGRDRALPLPADRFTGTSPDRLLAALLVRRGSAVPLDELTTAVWDDDPPMRPAAAVEVNLQALRRDLAPADLPVAALDGPAWRLAVPPEAVDLDEAAALAASGAQALADGRTEEAATTLRAALGHTSGEPLEGLDGPWFAAAREPIARWRADVVWRCVVAEVSCGRTGQALPDLRSLTRTYPLREDVAEWLVLATARHEGREAALAVYADAVHRLRRALGAEPGPALQAVRRRVETGQA